MPALVLFPAGMILGSFIGAVAHRLPRGESFVGGRSRCPGCRAPIAAYDNVPVLSWLALRGRCRSCAEPIPVRYPLAELGLGALYAGTYLAIGDQGAAALALGLVLCTVLVAVTLTDLDLRVIPNRIVAAGAVTALALVAAADPSTLPERGLAALAAGGVLLLVALAYPRGMGMGDVKLVAMMGLFLGREIAPALLVAFAAGALYGAVLIARRGAASRREGIPFGPFLALGGIAALWLGEPVVDAYLERFAA